MILTVAAAIVAVQLGAGAHTPSARLAVEPVQYRRPVRCGHGADLDIRDGRCYPNGTVPPPFQAGRIHYEGRQYGGRYPVRCGHGADLDIRDGRCYPTGAVPRRFQAARHHGGRYPVRCGHGADVDIRDGRCYPNGTVPPQFQAARQHPPRYDYDDYEEEDDYRPQRRRYGY